MRSGIRNKYTNTINDEDEGMNRERNRNGVGNMARKRNRNE